MQHNPMQNDPQQVPPKNIIVAVVLSILILMVFFFVFDKPRMDAKRAQQAAAQAKRMTAPQQDIASTETTEDTTPQTRDDIIDQNNLPMANRVERARFETDLLEGSISLKGGYIDDLSLLGHYTTVEKEELVHLFSPKGADQAYFADFGWVSQDQSLALPNKDTVWTLEENSSVADDANIAHRIVMSWDNGEGFVFRKTITIDHAYMLTVDQSVTNNSETHAEMHPYGLLDRSGKPIDYMGFFILHEGPLALIDDEMEAIDYDDVSLGGAKTFEDKKGWIGFTDKYWFASIIPANLESKNTIRYTRSGIPDNEDYQVDMVGEKHQLAPTQTISNTMRLYAGVKILSILQNYEDKYSIPNLDLAIDFGIYYFLTKPLFILLTWLGHTFGHIGIGILVLTVLLKLLTFPLSNKAYISMTKMSIIGPQMKKIKEKYANDREKLQMAFLELYQKEGVNPFSGCWPMLIQIPIFFSLYKVILTNVMLRHVPFWGWISDLSAPDPTSVLNLFGLLPYETPVMLTIGAWPCLMGLTMYCLNRMSPKPTDSTQALIKNYFPYMFTIMLARFATGLVIYWAWSNVLTILQQYVIMKRLGIPVSLIRGRLDDPNDPNAPENPHAPKKSDDDEADDIKDIDTTAKDITDKDGNSDDTPSKKKTKKTNKKKKS